ncbi:MAG: periplasmic heavy metal sensor [Acidobacteria bacterium]|nr:periplasmic heavy metal sensor [Acidobacteriota bacterium]MCA1651773.1 periplasmic heavy metal sensor [Acidobacteriota bacterium]
MARHITFALMAWLAASSVAGAVELCELQKPSAEHTGTSMRERGWKWWQDEKSRAELSLTPQQSAEIDQIFEGSIGKLREARHATERLEKTLSDTISANVADPSVVAQQAEKFETARAEQNRLRTVMLYRMHRVLNADQRARLKVMYERREGSRGKGGQEARRE